jgi:hypothetical protein
MNEQFSWPSRCKELCGLLKQKPCTININYVSLSFNNQLRLHKVRLCMDVCLSVHFTFETTQRISFKFGTGGSMIKLLGKFFAWNEWGK